MKHSELELRSVLSILAFTASTALGGCAAEEDTTGQIVADPIAAGLLSADWPGTKMGIAPPVFLDEGKMKIVEVEKRDVRPATPTFPAEPDFEDVPENEVTLIHTATGRSYSVTLPEKIGEVAKARAAELARKVMERPTLPEPTSAGTKKVIGDDTRVRLGITDGVAKEGWLAALGYRDGCTGVLISPTAYLTAAHCVFNKQGELEKSVFQPREDWSTTEGNLPLSPWGFWSDLDVIVPKAYTKNNCNGHFTASCIQYDIALVKVERDQFASEGHRWWFTPAYETREELQTRQLKNRGYAGCTAEKNGVRIDDPDAPSDCWSGHGTTLWGDQQSCPLGNDAYLDDPWSPEVYHGCDTNGGHSGSPMFYYRADGAPIVVGLHSSGERSGSEAINSFKRFSANTLLWINGLL
ncbi:MAG: trypsin-like serine protease [Polyangiales bacterium]